jgi:hypothetical protein
MFEVFELRAPETLGLNAVLLEVPVELDVLAQRFVCRIAFGEQLEIRSPVVFGCRRMRLNRHAVAHGCGAGGDQAAVTELHHAEAASSKGLQPIVVAKGGDFDLKLANGIENAFAGRHFEIDPVDR